MCNRAWTLAALIFKVLQLIENKTVGKAYLGSSTLVSSMRMTCHDIHNHGYVARTRLSVCLREWKYVKCFVDYVRGETALTEDATAPYQTPTWECSVHLLAGIFHSVAKYGLVDAPFLLFSLANLPCQVVYSGTESVERLQKDW